MRRARRHPATTRLANPKPGAAFGRAGFARPLNGGCRNNSPRSVYEYPRVCNIWGSDGRDDGRRGWSAAFVRVSGRFAGMSAVWLGLVLSIAALVCTLVVVFTDDDCDEALLVRARADATQPAASASLSSTQVSQASTDVAAILATCAAAKSTAFHLPALAGLLGLLALGSFALAIWIAKPWSRDDRVSYSGFRPRR